MRFPNSPSPNPGGREIGVDDVDRVMTDYFRSEMPNPWPAAHAAAPTIAPRLPAHPVHNASGSRFALAASIALILVGAWVLSGSFRDVGPAEKSSFHLGSGSANTKNGGTLELIQPQNGETKIQIRFPAEAPPMPKHLNQVNLP